MKATQAGYRKGCFGSPTRQTRRTARERVAAMRDRAYHYARSYVKGHRSKNTLFDKRMEDAARYRRELDRIAQRAMKRERGKDSEKRTTRAQKV